MTFVTTYASSKGGAGKTTTLLATCTELRARGLTTLLIDADPNRHLAEWAKLRGDAGVEVIDGVTEANIRQEIKGNAERFDHVLVDLAGFNNMSMVYAFSVSDLVIIPALRSRWDIKETIRTHRNVLDSMAEMRHQPEVRIILTRGKQAIRSRVSKHAETQLTSRELPMFRTELFDWSLLEELSYSGHGPIENQPDGNAAGNVRTVVSEMIAILEGLTLNPSVPRKAAPVEDGKVRRLKAKA